jgi:hypothetical protein
VKKILFRGFLVLLLILCIAITAMPLWVDVIAKSTVQSVATDALGVKTTLDSISLGVWEGQCELEGLEIGNPSGFSTPHFMKLGRGYGELSLETLMEDEVVMPGLTLDGVDINLEKTSSRANYEVILDNVSSGPPSEGPGTKFVIRIVTVRNVSVYTKTNVLGVKPSLRVTIPSIVLRDVGSGTEGGAVLGEIIKQILTGILKGVAESGVDLGKGIAKELGKGVENAAGAIGDIFR